MYLTESRFVMDTRTSVTMSASSNFEVKGTIYSKQKNKIELQNGEITMCNKMNNITYLSFSVPKIEARYSAILDY